MYLIINMASTVYSLNLTSVVRSCGPKPRNNSQLNIHQANRTLLKISTNLRTWWKQFHFRWFLEWEQRRYLCSLNTFTGSFCHTCRPTNPSKLSYFEVRLCCHRWPGTKEGLSHKTLPVASYSLHWWEKKLHSGEQFPKSDTGSKTLRKNHNWEATESCLNLHKL